MAGVREALFGGIVILLLITLAVVGLVELAVEVVTPFWEAVGG